jgi:hypothetical protein
MITITVFLCSCCGKTHRELPVIKLNKPMLINENETATHASVCPEKAEVIFISRELAKVTETE